MFLHVTRIRFINGDSPPLHRSILFVPARLFCSFSNPFSSLRVGLMAHAGLSVKSVSSVVSFLHVLEESPSGDCFSGPDLHFSSYRNQIPDLFNFLIGYGDASVGPVEPAVQSAEFGKRRWQPVDHDVPARTHAQLAGPCFVSSIWIRNMQGEMKLTMSVLLINHVAAFGCFMV